jgi:hypothetical protein
MDCCRRRRGREIEQRGDPLVEEAGGQLAQAADQLEVLAAREEGIQVRLLGDVTEAAPEGHEIGRDEPALEEDVALGRLDEPGQHLHRRALARARRSGGTRRSCWAGQ